MKPLISIGGGSCAGTTTASEIAQEELKLAGKDFFMYSQDNFYRNIPPHFTIEDKRNTDRDEPGSIDFKLNRKKVISLLQGYEAELEKYSYHAGQRFPWKNVKLKEGLIFEGLCALS